MARGGIASCPIEDMPLCTDYLPGHSYKLTIGRWVFSFVVVRKPRPPSPAKEAK